MSDEALRRLEELRRNAVERARLALAEAQRAQLARAEAQRAALGRRAACDRELVAAYQAFASARSVTALRAATTQVRLAKAELARAAARVGACEQAVRAAEREVRSRQDVLRSGEVARRALARTLEQRAADVSLRTERRLEDEAEDAFRARSRGV